MCKNSQIGIAGLIFILAGISFFIIPSIQRWLFLVGLSFILSCLLDIVYFFKNRSIIDGWGFYIIFLMIILNWGLYLILTTIVDVTMNIGLICLFYLLIFFGFILDLKKYTHLSWSNFITAYLLVIGFSIILLTKMATPCLAALAIIAMGFIFIFLDLEIIKLKKKHRFIKDLTEIEAEKKT